MPRLSLFLISLFIFFSCKNSNSLPDELENREWIEIFEEEGKYFSSPVNNTVITTQSKRLDVELMEHHSLKISKVDSTLDGYDIYTYNNWYEDDKIGDKINPWHFSFKWIDKQQGIGYWKYMANDSIHNVFSYITVDKKFFDKKKYPEYVELNDLKDQKHLVFLDSISRLKIDSHWNKQYNIWLSSYTPYYSYNYEIKVSTDSTYIRQRSLNDLLVPLQKKDTLFLYHKKALIEDYVEDKTKPELKIVHIDGKYYINSSLFDLENSISDKPTKYGFLVDEIN